MYYDNDNDYKSRKELGKIIFGDREKGEIPNYSFSNVVKYIFTIILLAVIVFIITNIIY